MPDPRFFTALGPLPLHGIIELTGADLVGGDPAMLIGGVAPLDEAGPSDLAFLDHRRYRAAAGVTRAGACLVRPEDADRLPASAARLVTPEPLVAYARAADALHGATADGTGVHRDASVDPSARLGPGCRVGARAVVEAAARLGARCVVEAGAVVGRGVVLGDDVRVGACASLGFCLVGDRVVVRPGARIGQDGFGYVPTPEGHRKVPQLGRVIVEDDVEIGANTTVDRGGGGDTVIGRGSKIDNLVQIAHNVRLGAGCVVVAQSGIAGSASIGAGSVLAAQAGVAGHLTIGPGTTLAGRTAVLKDLPGGQTWGGAPAMPVHEWRRHMAALARLGRTKGTTS